MFDVDAITAFVGGLFWMFLIVCVGLLIGLVILIWVTGSLASFFGDRAEKERALRTSIIGRNRSEVIANLRLYSGTNFGIHPPKVRTILRELINHPEQHYEEIDFLVDNQLTFVEMLDLIDRSELEDWHIARSQPYV